MTNTRATVVINQQVWDDVRKLCIDKKLDYSEFTEQALKEKLKREQGRS